MDHYKESFCHYKAAINHAKKMPIEDSIERLLEISDSALKERSKLMDLMSAKLNEK